MALRLSAARLLLAALALLSPILSYAGQSESGPTGIPCHEPLAAFRNGRFNLSFGAVRLRHGKGCLKLLPESRQCDWSIELTRVEKWGVGRQLLLVVIRANHETGSGAWDSVFLYACKHGAFVPVLSRRYLYGATIVVGQNSDLWITSGVWRSGDPSCCPSRERREHYAWNEARGQVVLTRVQATTPRGPK